ncbi:MAG: hypothetical protein ACI9SJ_000449 [Flavobacteriaceae bacterium]|jgi:hypothetical protein|uniref:hypothetical protein n=1 Tax=Candidatus Marifrigoribacter sp. Uisw_064 TaxID=3230970 RepID=UPI003ADFC280
MKYFLKITVVTFLVSLIWSCEDSKTKVGELKDYIPENTSVVLKISDFETLKADIKNNDLISEFSDTPAFSFISENNILHYLQPEGLSIFCISEHPSNYTFITRQTKNVFVTDSLNNITSEKILINDHPIYKVLIDSVLHFTTLKDSVFIASSSQTILQNIIEGNTESDPVFQKINSINNEKNFKAIIKTNNLFINDSLRINFASLASLNTQILPDAISATGVVLDRDSVPQLLSVFKGLVPQKNDIAKITPVDSKSVISVTFNDFETFQNNCEIYKGTNDSSIELITLLDAVSEASFIEHELGNSIVLSSLDPSTTKDAFLRYSTQKEVFKEVMIHDLNRPNLLSSAFYPFFKNSAMKYLFQIDQFFIVSENEAISQHIISSYLNNNCLINTTYYKESVSKLSSASSLLIMKLNGNISSSIASLFNSNNTSEINTIDFKKYPLAVLQLSYDRDFAHLNFLCKEVSSQKRTTGIVSQLASIKFENTLLKDPQFFSNHRTKGKDIIVQDVTNTLHFVSSKGKTLWTKKLDSPILGKVQEVDILKNGKKQLAFTTEKNFYILDRNGNTVAPFPMKFKDRVTQPLSVFDYDNKRNYRFIVTQGKEVLMYDSKGKIVKGFTFKKATSTIVLAPQHFRMARKDYILIAEENGTLNILSRVGKSRVSVKKSFNFSTMSIAKEGDNFVVITKENTKESISQTGKITTKKLAVSSNYWFSIKGKTKATLDDYLLRINGKLIELPFGIYTKPEIFTINRTTYITITETQEHKVYVYLKNGDLLAGLPIFGTSKAVIGDANNNGKLNLLVATDASTVVLYEN